MAILREMPCRNFRDSQGNLTETAYNLYVGSAGVGTARVLHLGEGSYDLIYVNVDRTYNYGPPTVAYAAIDALARRLSGGTARYRGEGSRGDIGGDIFTCQRTYY